MHEKTHATDHSRSFCF